MWQQSPLSPKHALRLIRKLALTKEEKQTKSTCFWPQFYIFRSYWRENASKKIYMNMSSKHVDGHQINQTVARCCTVTSFRYSDESNNLSVGEGLGGINLLLLKAESVSSFTDQQLGETHHQPVLTHTVFGQLRPPGLYSPWPKLNMDTHVKRGEVYLQHQKYSEVRLNTVFVALAFYFNALITF